jgi:hypothetical protein
MTSNTQLRTRLSHAGLSQGARVVGFVDTMSTRLVGALSQRRDLAIGLCLCVLPTYRGHDPVGLGPKAIMRVPEIPGAPGWISQLFTRAKSRIALRASQRALMRPRREPSTAGNRGELEDAQPRAET